MDPHFAFARPRVGLLGNPSDLYGGKVVGFTFDAFEAATRLKPRAGGIELEVVGSSLAFDSWSALVAGLDPAEMHGGAKLIAAALKRLMLHAPHLADLADDDPRAAFGATFSTDVPRQAGLSGSSAIVIASLRALAGWFEVECSPFELSEMALAAENDDLGITAGPQDRVIQAYGGLVAMDFTGQRAPEAYRRLDPALLPAMLVVWRDEPGTSSAHVHHDVRERWLADDATVRALMARFPGIVDRGLMALEAQDLATLTDVIDENFDTRAEVFPIADLDREMIEVGRGEGAATKFCGSGGAVLAVPREPLAIGALEEAYRAAGMRTVRPRVGPLEATFR